MGYVEEQLFPKSERPAAPLPVAPVAQVAALATRLKLAEERYTNLQKRNQLTEGSMLAFERDMKAELRAITHQVVEMRRHVQDVNAKVDTMLGELGSLARKHEVQVLERYLDLWQPTRFVTREEAKRMLEVRK